MGTTLTAGWLEDRWLTLANLGDSRAYLIEDDHIEQLTVDGDLEAYLLQRKFPPEEVQGLGSLAHALQTCVGGYVRDPEGNLAPQEQHCTPVLSRWPLLPGDILVFCTDGVVEEGSFLEPEEVLHLVRQNADLSAEALAALLLESANDLQRTPS